MKKSGSKNCYSKGGAVKATSKNIPKQTVYKDTGKTTGTARGTGAATRGKKFSSD